MLSALWETIETPSLTAEEKLIQLQAQIGLDAAYVEQSALDSGKKHLSWLLTGLKTPAWHLIGKQVPSDQPYSHLIDAKWLAANIAYLRDIEFLTQKAKATAKGGGEQDPAQMSARAKALAKKRAAEKAAKEKVAKPK